MSSQDEDKRIPKWIIVVAVILVISAIGSCVSEPEDEWIIFWYSEY